MAFMYLVIKCRKPLDNAKLLFFVGIIYVVVTFFSFFVLFFF